MCKKAESLTRISSMAKTQICIDRGIFVPPNTRCCKRHLNNNFLIKGATNAIEVKSDYSRFSDETFCELLGKLLRSVAARKGLDFDYPPALTDSDYYNLIGLKKDQFNAVANCIKKRIKSTSGRSYRTCLTFDKATNRSFNFCPIYFIRSIKKESR